MRPNREANRVPLLLISTIRDVVVFFELSFWPHDGHLPVSLRHRCFIFFPPQKLRVLASPLMRNGTTLVRAEALMK
jgi:hypothetical protein